MAPFLSGGGDLKATTLEQAQQEVVMLIDSAEKLQFEDLGIARRLAWTADLGAQSTTFSITMPMTTTVTAGVISHTVKDYLGNNLGVFNPGVGGTLSSTTLPAALVEVASLINNAELAIVTTVATVTPHTTVVTSDENAKTITVTGTMPIATLIDVTTGGIIVSAIPFLP